MLDRSDLATDPRYASTAARLDRRHEVDAIVAAWTCGRDEIELQATLQMAGVPAHRVQSSEECLADPQLRARRHFVQVNHPLHGSVTIEGTRFTLSRSPNAVDRPGPLMGEHNAYVLKEILGYDDERIAALITAGALT